MNLAIAIQLSIFCIIQAANLDEDKACGGCCTAGTHGIPGTHGVPGAPGPIGLKGDIGMKGEKGNQGIDGKDGLEGKIGPIGLKGATGEKGERGEKGDQGKLINQPKSAFSVGFRNDPGQLPISPIKYTTTFTNIGSDYNEETGKFVCQHPGTYIFQFASGSRGGKKLVTKIMKNGLTVVSAFERRITNHCSIGNMVVLDLEADDEVWTQPGNTKYNYYYSNSNTYCTFSGFLLNPKIP